MGNPPKFDKFVLENDFFELAIQEEKRDPRLTEEALAQAEAKGYAAGLAKGQEQGRASMSEEMQTHLLAIKDKLDKLEQARADIQSITGNKALQLVRKMLHKLADAVKERFSNDIIADAFTKALGATMKETRLAIHLGPTTYKYVKNTPQVLALFEGRHVTLKEDPALKTGACVVEWDTGGLTVALEQAWQEMDATLEAAILQSAEPQGKSPVAAEPTATVSEKTLQATTQVAKKS